MNASFDLTGVVLESKRLILRGWQLSDLDDFYNYASVPGVGEMAGWHHHENKEESLKTLKHFIDGKHVFAIILKQTGKAIGSIGVEPYEMEDEFSEFFEYRGREIGYVLGKDYWGQGLMPEAVQRLIDYLFQEQDLDFLLCGHFQKNHQSRRVQEKCGFVPYRKLVFDTRMGTKEPGTLRLLINPKKNIQFAFSHPETLLIE